MRLALPQVAPEALRPGAQYVAYRLGPAGLEWFLVKVSDTGKQTIVQDNGQLPSVESVVFNRPIDLTEYTLFEAATKFEEFGSPRVRMLFGFLMGLLIGGMSVSAVYVLFPH